MLRLIAIALLLLRPAISADLAHEDLASVRAAFHKADPSLSWFDAARKEPLDARRSVLIVQAAPNNHLDPDTMLIGVFVVSGPANRVEQVLDLLPEREVYGFPSIDLPAPNTIDLHFYSDYGIYQGSIKYLYDSAAAKSPVKIPFGILGINASLVKNGVLTYSAVSSSPRMERLTIAIEPRAGDTLPAFRILSDSGPRPAPVPLPDIPLPPVPTMELYRQLRPASQAPAELENKIGPFAIDGPTVWFANRFYDGEGTSGIGAIGTFDTRTRRFEMRYLPEVVPWSGSAMRLDGDDLWLGLATQPEGAAESGGLLRYNIRTGGIVRYDVPDLIHTIDRVGDAIYCGTANGLYRLRGAEIVHMFFEPDASGNLTMFTRTSSLPDKPR